MLMSGQEVLRMDWPTKRVRIRHAPERFPGLMQRERQAQVPIARPLGAQPVRRAARRRAPRGEE
jgi:hypothetical protein